MTCFKTFLLSILWTVLVTVVPATLGQRVSAANGDVATISSVLLGRDLTDCTFDPSPNPPGGSFWVAGKMTGKIYHLSADCATLLGEINNPHGVGSIPNFILTWGIAYRPTTQSLLVLAQDQGSWKIREVKTSDGSEVLDGAFTITPPDPDSAAIRGIAYDAVLREIWYLDANNDKVVRTDFSGIAVATFSLPGSGASGSILRGEGIGCELEEVAPLEFATRLYVSYGDIFRRNPSRIIQLTETGQTTGIETPLSQMGSLVPMGFQTFQFGIQRRIAVMTSSGSIAQVEQVIPVPVPPSDLRCTLTLSNKAELTWKNNGTGSNGSYGGEITILRNGVPFATVSGTTETFVDETPHEGTSTYALEASELPGGTDSPPCFPCDITVGTGGLVRWVPFDGQSIFDAARDPRNGDLFVTDNVGSGSGGKILQYDASLNLLGEVPSPWTRPGPITFVPLIQIQSVTLENVLAVGRTDGLLLSIMDLTGDEKTTFPLETRVANAQLGGLTYLPQTQEFVVMELTEHRIVFVDQGGRFRRTCIPPDLFGFPPMSAGITYDPIQDAFLALFQDGVVRELYTGGSCAPSRFEFALQSLGEGYNSPGFFGGIQIAGNTLVVCAKESNAIFQALVFPYSPPFQRGDFDRNNTVNVTDAVQEASYLFQSGAAPRCQDAADVNDDAVLDIADPVYLLFYLFLQGPPPPAPFPSAGTDPTFRDNLGCEE